MASQQQGRSKAGEPPVLHGGPSSRRSKRSPQPSPSQGRAAGRSWGPVVLPWGEVSTATLTPTLGSPSGLEAAPLCLHNQVLWKGFCRNVAGRDFLLLHELCWQIPPSILGEVLTLAGCPMNYPRHFMDICPWTPGPVSGAPRRGQVLELLPM